jgi:undecaprenyl-diphosphatase
LDLSGAGFVMIGVLLLTTARSPALPAADARASLTGIWLLGTGLALILEALPAAAGLLGAAGWTFVCRSPGLARPQRAVAETAIRATPGQRVSWFWQLQTLVSGNVPVLCGSLTVAVLLDLSHHAAAPGGPRAHAMELGVNGIILALAGIAWAGWSDGLAALGWGQNRGLSSLLPSPARPAVWGLLFFSVFLLLTLLIQHPAVPPLDTEFVRHVYRSGPPALTALMRRISNAGGGDLLVYWLPLLGLVLCLSRRARSLRFLGAVMVGTVGLETVFKMLISRPRPELVHGVHFNSFPSGHVFAATALCGVLLLIYLPACRQLWQRILLWAVGILWPLSMAAARVYLGRHFATDVAGGVLLGVSWVLLCQSLLLAVVWFRSQVNHTPLTATPLRDAKGRNHGSPALVTENAACQRKDAQIEAVAPRQELTEEELRAGETRVRAISFLVAMLEDVTAQHRTEERNSALQILGERLNVAATPKDAARIVLDVADQLLGWDCGWVELIDAEGTQATGIITMDLLEGIRSEVPPMAHDGKASPFTLRVIEEGAILILSETARASSARSPSKATIFTPMMRRRWASCKRWRTTAPGRSCARRRKRNARSCNTNYCTRRRWKQWVGWPVGWRTTSTICSR